MKGWLHFEDVSGIEHEEGILTVLIGGSWLSWHNYRHNNAP